MLQLCDVVVFCVFYWLVLYVFFVFYVEFLVVILFFFALSLLSFKLVCYHDQTQTKMHMDGAMNDFVSWCMIHHVSYQRFCMHSYRVSHLT